MAVQLWHLAVNVPSVYPFPCRAVFDSMFGSKPMIISPTSPLLIRLPPLVLILVTSDFGPSYRLKRKSSSFRICLSLVLLYGYILLILLIKLLLKYSCPVCIVLPPKWDDMWICVVRGLYMPVPDKGKEWLACSLWSPFPYRTLPYPSIFFPSFLFSIPFSSLPFPSLPFRSNLLPSLPNARMIWKLILW